MKYRPLVANEIQTLQKQGCIADDWQQVQVKDGFKPERLFNVRFGAAVRLGVFDADLEVEPGIQKPAGIYHSFLHDCSIGDDVYIADVKTLSHYEVESRVIIENVASLTVVGTTCFGNGVTIEVLNEGGGRELVIFDKLSAQIAYLMATWRHDADFIRKLTGMIRAYADEKKSDRGRIQTGAKIAHCGIIRNAHLGVQAQVIGAQLLEEGTIASCPEHPTVVGSGVIARDFIILSGARVDGSAMLSRCFVGQAVKIGRQFSAENSAIFANSECFHGEACSIFAGPYTVTHHKSTLLIAGLFSFYNAGSGTNQSNHMYKLGPLHQGILERGCKTGSFSYLLWPARIGAFTAVVGKHYANFDTSALPFSYISEDNGRSALTPAMNLFTVGTRRDSAKWPDRDRRRDPDRLDLIDFELFNPYTVGKILQGIKVLDELAEKASKEREYVSYNGILIKRLLLKTCRKYYEMAMKIYLGRALLNRLGDMAAYHSFSQVLDQIRPVGSEGTGAWIDLSGMIAPASIVQNLVTEVANGKIPTITELLAELRRIHGEYSQMAWRYCLDVLLTRLGITFADLSKEHLVKIIQEGAENQVKLNNMILKDAEKEFDQASHIGYGIDGDVAVREQDFQAVRGNYNGNKFVLEVQIESQAVAQRAEEWILKLKNLSDRQS